MSYLVLARKYRPQTFGEVVAQTHVTQTLTNAIHAERVAHAILFAGPRGTGKTTIARILAKAMNCQTGPTPEPCNRCRSCEEITGGNAADVFEIDGASNNSVDQIRELRENVKYLPAHSPYKIYITDEVHMLSIAAFNALLKTLEEPPPHVLFFFATTEVHKIPVTILSRCQRHDLRRVDLKSLADHLQMIARREDVRVPEESLWLIAREAGGSVRDALSLLDQVMTCAREGLSHDLILNLLGVVDRKVLFDLSDALLQRDVTTLLELLEDIYRRGHELKKLYTDLIEHFRNLLVVKLGGTAAKLVDVPGHEIDLMQKQIGELSAGYLTQLFETLLKEESSVRFATQPKLAIEMICIRLLELEPALPIEHLIDKLDRLQQALACTTPSVEPPARPPDPAEGAPPPPTPPEAHPSAAQAFPPDAPVPEPEAHTGSDDPWGEIYARLTDKYPSLAANLAQSRLQTLSDDAVEIEVNGNDFNLNMIGRPKNMAILKKLLRGVFGREMQVTIKARVMPQEKLQREKKEEDRLKREALNHPLVTEAVEIFSGRVIDVKIL